MCPPNYSGNDCENFIGNLTAVNNASSLNASSRNPSSSTTTATSTTTAMAVENNTKPTARLELMQAKSEPQVSVDSCFNVGLPML